MKKFVKIIAAVLAASFIGFGFSGCKNDEDPAPAPSSKVVKPYLPAEYASKKVVAKYSATLDGNDIPVEDGGEFGFNLGDLGGSMTMVIAAYFFDDNEVLVTESMTMSFMGMSQDMKSPLSKGTYTGTPAANQTITVKFTQDWDDETEKWIDPEVIEDYEVTIDSKNCFELKEVDDDFPMTLNFKPF